jgi:hypothetical protein
MATIVKQKSGRWRARACRKGRSLSETYSLRNYAEAYRRFAIASAKRQEDPLDSNVNVARSGGEHG